MSSHTVIKYINYHDTKINLHCFETLISHPVWGRGGGDEIDSVSTHVSTHKVALHIRTEVCKSTRLSNSGGDVFWSCLLVPQHTAGTNAWTSPLCQPLLLHELVIAQSQRSWNQNRNIWRVRQCMHLQNVAGSLSVQQPIPIPTPWVFGIKEGLIKRDSLQYSSKEEREEREDYPPAMNRL